MPPRQLRLHTLRLSALPFFRSLLVAVPPTVHPEVFPVSKPGLARRLPGLATAVDPPTSNRDIRAIIKPRAASFFTASSQVVLVVGQNAISGAGRCQAEGMNAMCPGDYSLGTSRCTCESGLARIHRWTGMDGVRTAEGGEGVTGAMIRARIWVDGRLAGGLQALLGAPMAAYSGCGERDGGIGHGKRRSRTGLARVCWDVGLAGGSVADGRRQAGSGMARSRARARLNCSSQGQRRGRCRVNRRAERVIRPAKAKTRRLRVLVVTIC